MRLLALSHVLLLGLAILGCSGEEPGLNPSVTPEGGKSGASSAQTDQADKTKSQAKPPSSGHADLKTRQVVQMELMGQEDTKANLGYGNCQWLEPLDAPKEKLIQEPVYKSNKPIYYAAHYGDAKDNIYTFVLDESGGPGKGYDLFYIDLNNDNRLDAKNESFKIGVSSPSDGVRKNLSESVRIRLMVTAGGVTAPYYVSLSAFKYKDDKRPIENIHANLRNSSYYGGEAVFQGKTRKIAIADLNSNGLFNDVEQGLFHGDRFFIDLGDDDKPQNEKSSMESFPYGGYTRIAGNWYTIIASPDGSQVKISPAKPPLGKVVAQPRIAKAQLLSKDQELNLEFVKNIDSGVVGTYKIQNVLLLAENESSERGGLSGVFADNAPQLTIRLDQTTALLAGGPLEVQVQYVPKDADGTIEFSINITGIGGEKYTWRQKTPATPKAGFEIVDESGKQIASETFEFG